MKIKAIFIRSLPVLFLFLVSALCILPFFLSHTFPYAGDYSGSDLTELNLPLRYAAAQAILSGQIPLWQPDLDNGFPLLAEGQAGVFYPLNILYLFLPFVTAVNLGFFFNFFLASLFAYIYARCLKLSLPAALFSAIAFAFSGFFVFRIKHVNMINAAIWLPLIFFFVEKYFSDIKKFKWLALMALVFSIQFFAGHPQISYFSILSAFFYFSLKFIFQSPGLRKIPLKDWLAKILLPWLILGAMTFGLSAIQFLPTLELSFFSERSKNIDFEWATINTFPPRQLLTVFQPYLFDNPAQGLVYDTSEKNLVFWENNCYFGWLSAIFALLALICLLRSERQVKFFGILLLVFLFFIFGRYNLLFIGAWFLIPGMKAFRFSQRFLLPFILISSLLAGIGLDLCLRLLKNILADRLKLKKAGLIVGLTAIACLIILVSDVFIYGRQYVAAMPADYFRPNQTVAWLKQDQEVFRYLAVDWQDSWFAVNKKAGGWTRSIAEYYWHRQLIQPDNNLFFGLAAADERGWIEGGQLYEPLARLNWLLKDQQSFINNATTTKIILSDSYLKIYGMQNVKYLLSFYQLENSNLQLRESFLSEGLPDLRIYENKYFLPRAFLAFDYRVEANEIKYLRKMADDFFDYSRELVLAEAPAGLDKPDQPSPIKAVEIKSWEDQKIRLSASAQTPSLLFLSLINYPGWQAYVDGRPAEILAANQAFSAVVLPAGDHEVLFVYRPVWFYAGLVISLLTAFFILLLFLLMKLFKHK